MIITQKKPIEELMAMLEGATKIGLLGCGSCATACATGGEKEIKEMTEYLETQWCACPAATACRWLQST